MRKDANEKAGSSGALGEMPKFNHKDSCDKGELKHCFVQNKGKSEKTTNFCKRKLRDINQFLHPCKKRFESNI